jgi:flagellar biosynthesis chaperone FliJ
LCNRVENTTIKSDHSTLRTAVEKQLDKVTELEKRSFIDADYSIKDIPADLKDATKQLNILINRKAELASVLKENYKESYNMIKTDFMSLYESLSTLNEDAKTDASKAF